MITVLVIMAGVTINLGYISLLRTQQKVAIDASAKAAVEALVRTEDQAAAATAAQTIAGMHKVGSETVSVALENIHFGRSEEQSDGSFLFQKDLTPPNSARIISLLGAAGDTPAVPLFFPGMKHGKFRGSVASVSTFLMNEVVLCLDRSGSMKFDMTGTSWSYPDGGFSWDRYYGPAHSTESRWAHLRAAIEVFMDEAEVSVRPPRVALVTWSSDTADDGISSTDYALPANGFDWATNRTDVTNALNSRSAEEDTDGVYGGTQMALGFQAGIDAFDTPNAHPMANRVIVLLTDGQYQGDDPYDVALTARNAGITVHCISLLAGETYDKAKSIAEATGGGAYMANNGQELKDAFAEIARSLNIVLTE
jgi:hypothetical protein